MQPGVYKVHLPIILEEGLAVYRERKERKKETKGTNLFYSFLMFLW